MCMCAYACVRAHALGCAGKSKGKPVRSRQHTHRESSLHVQANRNRSSYGPPPDHPRMCYPWRISRASFLRLLCSQVLKHVARTQNTYVRILMFLQYWHSISAVSVHSVRIRCSEANLSSHVRGLVGDVVMTVDGTLVTTKNVEALLKGGIFLEKKFKACAAGLHVTSKFCLY